jgi:hypothetical protein
VDVFEGWQRKLPAPIDSSAAALEKALTQETYARKEEDFIG